MLTDREVRLLLAHAMAYDARIQPGDAIAAAWTEAAKRGRWTYDEALEAVHDHYATSSAWLMPGTVTQAIRATRQDTAMRAAAQPPPPPDTIGQARVAAITARAFHEIPAVDTPQPRRPSPLTVACPHCHAGVGSPCTVAGRPMQKTPHHPSRADALAEQLKRGA